MKEWKTTAISLYLSNLTFHKGYVALKLEREPWSLSLQEESEAS